MKASIFATLMTIILLLHYLIPYYVTHSPVDAWYWLVDSTIALLFTLYYLFRGEQWWKKD